MAPIHVDESAGSDETGKGTPEQPYQTLAFALYTHPEEKFVIRKDASAAYEEPTQSALKKAKKGADGIEKKRKKAEELAEREAKEKAEARERKEKRLEESKKIVLQEDPSLPKAVKVRIDFRRARDLLISRAEQDRKPDALAVKTHPHVGMGAPSARPEGDHLRCAPGRDWLPSVCPVWTGCADIRGSDPHARVDDRSGRHAKDGPGGADRAWRARTCGRLLEGPRRISRWRRCLHQQIERSA